MRYHVVHDEDAVPDRQWLVIDDVYGWVVAYTPTKELAKAAADSFEGSNAS